MFGEINYHEVNATFVFVFATYHDINLSKVNHSKVKS